MSFSLDLSTASLLYGPEKEVKWQDASTLQAKVGSFSASSAMPFLPPPKPELSPLVGYSLNKAISTTPFLVYTSAYNILLLQKLHLITFWLCPENKKVELSTGYATLAKSYICQQIPNSIRRAILKS